MNESRLTGAGVIADMLNWHIPSMTRQRADELGAEIWAEALQGDFGALRWQAGETAGKVAKCIKDAGEPVTRSQGLSMANRILSELLREAAIRGQRDVKPRPHLFKTAPYDDKADMGRP